jgi:hypothetical protein
MPVSTALERLARYGLWLDPQDSAARDWIEQAKLSDETFEDAARRLGRDPRGYAAAIRRQFGVNILWYALRARDVLQGLARKPAGQSLLDALSLHEPDSLPPAKLDNKGVPTGEGVVLDGDNPIAVSLEEGQRATSPRSGGRDRGRGIGVERDIDYRGTERVLVMGAKQTGLWPHLDCKSYVPAGVDFTLTVSLAEIQQKGTFGGTVELKAPPGAASVDLTVELTADGIDCQDGWSKDLQVALANPTRAKVEFHLVGRPPETAPPEPHLTTLEVRYIQDGNIVGLASRPVIIGHAAVAELPRASEWGVPWLDAREVRSTVTLAAGDRPADLTIELTKPDRNEAGGQYVCRLYSPHAIAAAKGPYRIDLGTDARTFAMQQVSLLRPLDKQRAVDLYFRAVSGIIARLLPAEALAALREVAQKVAPEAPAVLIVSAEPYVPWELALIDPPLDPQRPPYLGAQALVGRWLRDPHSPSGAGLGPLVVDRPPTQPPSSIDVRLMAVMAGLYKKKESQLNPLPGAVQEAAEILQAYNALEMPATLGAFTELLDRELKRNFQPVGGADAFHFAGHGYFDPAWSDGAVLYLSNGDTLPPILFEGAKYGGEQQPFFFLNACMLGIGGEVLNDIAGFPGHCLRGGFGALLGALWVVDDSVARDVAIEFWRRALAPGGAEEPVAAVLRDIRSKYDSKAPQTTYLAYVFYGHPRLSLKRSAVPATAVVDQAAQVATPHL